MTRISSSFTFLRTRVYPVLHVVLCAGFLLHLVVVGAPMAMCIAALLVGIVGVLSDRQLLRDVRNEVLDYGDSLIVRDKGCVERIMLCDILDMTYTGGGRNRSPLITLSLLEPTEFGTRISFIPASNFLFPTFSMPPIAKDLTNRIETAKARFNTKRPRLTLLRSSSRDFRNTGCL